MFADLRQRRFSPLFVTDRLNTAPFCTKHQTSHRSWNWPGTNRTPIISPRSWPRPTKPLYSTCGECSWLHRIALGYCMLCSFVVFYSFLFASCWWLFVVATHFTKRTIMFIFMNRHIVWCIHFVIHSWSHMVIQRGCGGIHTYPEEIDVYCFDCHRLPSFSTCYLRWRSLSLFHV